MKNGALHVCVAGAGMSAAAAAHHLAEKGHRVTLIDPGKRLEPHLQALYAVDKPVDRKAFLGAVRRERAQAARDKGLPPKLPFGSRFAYETAPDWTVHSDGTGWGLSSMAIGGLSNAWGSNVCAVADGDLREWPFPAATLSPYFSRVRNLVEVSGRSDMIDELYDAKLGGEESYEIGACGRHVLNRAASAEHELRGAGIYVGRAKLAIGKRQSRRGVGCISCGLCMHGCPEDAVYNAANVIDSLVKSGRVELIAGETVETFSSLPDGVAVHSRTMGSDQATTRSFDRLLVGCGVFATGAIVLRSLHRTDRPLRILDSQKYIFPFMLDRWVSDPRGAEINTLSQVFIQAKTAGPQPTIVSCQLYGYNDLLLEPFSRYLGSFAYRLEPLALLAFRRLMIAMVYLHSDVSGTLTYEVSPAGSGQLGRISGRRSERGHEVLAEFHDRLTAHRREIGGRPLRRLTAKNLPGNSQHFGGTFPMRRDPGELETDALGRLSGVKNVHLIDGSVFPSIPGTPTGMLIMANATRIADAVQ